MKNLSHRHICLFAVPVIPKTRRMTLRRLRLKRSSAWQTTTIANQTVLTYGVFQGTTTKKNIPSHVRNFHKIKSLLLQVRLY